LVRPLRGTGCESEGGVDVPSSLDKLAAYQAVITACVAYADARYSHPESWMDEDGESPVMFRQFLATLNDLRNTYEGRIA
jgi:hypothetical protein